MKELSLKDTEMFDLVNIPIIVLERNTTGKVVYKTQNNRACELFELSREDVIGRSVNEVHPGRLGKLAYERHQLAMNSSAPSRYQVPVTIDDCIYQIETTLQPILAANGQVVQLIGTCREVCAEQAVQTLQIDAQALESEVEQFVNLAAHDLRAPMRNVNALTGMLKDGFQDLGDGKLEIINMLEKVTSSTLKLIGDVLKHANGKRQQCNSCTVEFDLQPVFMEIMTMLDPMHKVDAHSANGLFKGDATVTQIVLRNLIDNAIKHNRDNKLCLCLSVLKDKAPDGFYQLRLTDNGSGFPDPSTAFLDSARESIDQGGFGLLGVQRLVKSRGGTISAENLDSGGAAITFTLPGQLLDRANVAPAAEPIEDDEEMQLFRKTG